MDVTPLITRDKKVIQSYRGGLKISGVVYSSPVIVLPDTVFEWTIKNISNIQLDDFMILKSYMNEIEVFLLGTGVRQVMLSPGLRQAIKQAYGFTIDAMDTGAACRTYNVLMAEGRKIAAGLIPL